MEQSKSTRVVVFTKNNARIFINPENKVDLLKLKDSYLNPCLLAVRGTPPHYWFVKNGKILPMTQDMKEKRDRDILKYGVGTSIFDVKEVEVKKSLLGKIREYLSL